MKKAVVFYSLTGNTRTVGQAIAGAVGADVIELKPKKDVPARGFMKLVLGGYAVMKAKTPELMPIDGKPEEYDLLFIGTPVWAGSFAPALRSLFAARKIVAKRVAVFCCHGGGKGGVFAKMEQALAGNKVLGTIDFREPLKTGKDEAISRAEDWAREMINAAERSEK